MTLLSRMAGLLRKQASPLEAVEPHPIETHAIFVAQPAPAAEPPPPIPKPAAPDSAPQTPRAIVVVKPLKLALSAHVSGLGDRDADGHGWVGDIEAGRRIEGFVLQCTAPDWRSLCTCVALLPDGSLGPAVAGGSYCGTKGKGQPLHGFIVTLPADRAEFADLHYEGRFLDGFRSPVLRSGEDCRSPTNAALIAMRIAGSAPAAADASQSAMDDETASLHDRTENPDPGLADLAPCQNGVNFLAPSDLARTPVVLRRVALIGSCFLQAWNLHGRYASACAFDVFTVNNAANLPEKPSPDAQIGDYDFQIIQLAMRSFFHDDILTKLPYVDIAAHEKALEDAAQRMAFQLSCCLKWNIAHGILTFVANFPLPQRNSFGLLFPRFDIRNPEHFIYLLNQKLESLVRSHRNAYILDVDRISASFGRRYIQDDIISTTSHNSILGLRDTDWNRIEPMAPLGEHYDIPWGNFLSDAIWAEALCMYRVVRQTDPVKLVIVDLDDTLWQGVSGEMAHVDGMMLAGWPEGLVEALLYLKKRGILLAIVSKNEEQRIRAIWRGIFGNRLSLEDFAAIRVNWRPKAENIVEVLSLVNLLPRSVVFIDDNPAERAAVQGAFPDIRILGRHPYYLRRILLWSSETQNIAISAESERRTEMVQAQVLREETRSTVSREAFLAAASPQVGLAWMASATHPRFARAFELLNKTNQFNTTGKRWSDDEMRAFFAAGGRAAVFDVTDSFTDYGLVGVVLVRRHVIEQWVMSCRVLGLDIEIAVMAHIIDPIRANGSGDVEGLLVTTDANFPCRDLFAKCGFDAGKSSWRLAQQEKLSCPAHVSVVLS